MSTNLQCMSQCHKESLSCKSRSHLLLVQQGCSHTRKRHPVVFNILKRIYVLTESSVVGKYFQVSKIAISKRDKKSKHGMLHSLSAVKQYRPGTEAKSSASANQQRLTDAKLMLYWLILLMSWPFINSLTLNCSEESNYSSSTKSNMGWEISKRTGLLLSVSRLPGLINLQSLADYGCQWLQLQFEPVLQSRYQLLRVGRICPPRKETRPNWERPPLSR